MNLRQDLIVSFGSCIVFVDEIGISIRNPRLEGFSPGCCIAPALLLALRLKGGLVSFMMLSSRMKGMRWIITLNVLLAGIVLFIAGVLASSWMGGAPRRPLVAPSAATANQESPPRKPLKVPPVCVCSVDLESGEFVMKLTNVSDDPLSYVGWTMCFPRFRMQEYIADRWVGTGSLGCGLETREILTLQSGKTVTFREALWKMRHPVRYHLHITARGGRASEVLLGEYWP